MGLNKNQNSGNFNDEVVDMSNYATKDELNNKADIDDVPTKISELQNDSNFLTSIPSEYVTDTELNAKGYLTEHQNISGKADKSYVDTELAKKSDKTHAHSYNDLSDKPVIPSINGLATKKELTDGLATKSDKTHTHDQYLTSIPSEYVTDDELNNALAVLIARIEELEERLNSGVE